MGFNSGRLSSVIGTIYEAAYDRDNWPLVVEELRVAFNGSKSCFAKAGPDPTPDDAITTNPDPEYFIKYINDHAPFENVLMNAITPLPTGLIYSDHSLVGHEKLRASRFWNEWMAPQDMYDGMACKIMVTGPSSWFFDIQRGRNQSGFDSDDHRWFKELMPHLLRANQISQRFSAVGMMSTVFDQLSFGVLIVDARQRIKAMNAAAEAIVAHPSSGISVLSGVLTTKHLPDAGRLQKLIEDVCRRHDDILPGVGGDMLLRSGYKDQAIADLAISVGPLQPGGLFSGAAEGNAILLIRTLALDLPTDFADQARGMFGLTLRESQLASSLAEGFSLKEAALRRGIRFTTARSYLERIFEKTGVRQQSQLVAVLKTVQPLLRRIS